MLEPVNGDWFTCKKEASRCGVAPPPDGAEKPGPGARRAWFYYCLLFILFILLLLLLLLLLLML